LLVSLPSLSLSSALPPSLSPSLSPLSPLSLCPALPPSLSPSLSPSPSLSDPPGLECTATYPTATQSLKKNHAALDICKHVAAAADRVFLCARQWQTEAQLSSPQGERRNIERRGMITRLGADGGWAGGLELAWLWVLSGLKKAGGALNRK